MRDEVWDHNEVLDRLKGLMDEYGDIRTKRSIEHYSPDLVCEIAGKVVVFEVETYANPSKIVQDIVFSYVLGAEKLVIVFSNKHGRGKRRVDRATSIEDSLVKHFPQLCKLRVMPYFASDSNDLRKIVRMRIRECISLN